MGASVEPGSQKGASVRALTNTAGVRARTAAIISASWSAVASVPSGRPSSVLTPTAPAWASSAATSATAVGSSANPDSMRR